MFQLGLSVGELMKRGVKIGADVPYCIMRGTALAEGIGEKLTKLPPMPFCYVLIGKPGINVSTKFVYGNLDLKKIEYHPRRQVLKPAGHGNGLNSEILICILKFPGKIHQPQTGGESITCDNSHQDRGKLQSSLGKMVQSYDNNQGKQSGKPVFPGTVIRGFMGKSDHDIAKRMGNARRIYTCCGTCDCGNCGARDIGDRFYKISEI